MNSITKLSLKIKKNLLNQFPLLKKEEDFRKWKKQYTQYVKSIKSHLKNENVKKEQKVKLMRQLKEARNLKYFINDRSRRKNENVKKKLLQKEENLLSRVHLIKSEADKTQWIKDYNCHLKCLNSYLDNRKEKISIGMKQHLLARIAKLICVHEKICFNLKLHSGSGLNEEKQTNDLQSETETVAALKWEEVETARAFKNRIITGIIINLQHIDPSIFLSDAKNVVIENVLSYVKQHKCIKVNTVFNAEFTIKQGLNEESKREIKSFKTRNEVLLDDNSSAEIFDNWYVNNISKPILTSLEEFQERDSGWALSKIINLIININKCYLLNAGKGRGNCNIPLAIRKRKATVSIDTDENENDCFAWAITSALYPASHHSNRKKSYPHYKDVLNLTNITFPVTIKHIPSFEKNNNLSINLYQLTSSESEDKSEGKKYEILPLRLSDKISERKHINLLIYQNEQDEEDNMWHYVWIKNLSRLLAAQINKHQHKLHICDRYF